MTNPKPLSPAAQVLETREFLSEWFRYDTSSPSCLSWRKRPPHGRKGKGEHCSYFSKYYRVRLMGKWFSCHRIILVLNGFNPRPGQVADHINRNRRDNRIENLRWSSPSQNRANTGARNDSGWKHAKRIGANSYRANYRVLGENKTNYCGTYPTAYQAHIGAITHKLENCWKP